MDRKFPTLRLASLESDRALHRVTQSMAGLLENEYPLFRIAASPDIDAISPSHQTVEKALLRQALNELGYDSEAYKVYPPRDRHRSFGGGDDEGPHLDYSSVYTGRVGTSMSLRRHVGAVAAADVTMRHAKFTESERNGKVVSIFEFSRSAPIYRVRQRPGDRLVFVSAGGDINGHSIKPAFHEFVTLGSKRKANIIDFEFRPKPE